VTSKDGSLAALLSPINRSAFHSRPSCSEPKNRSASIFRGWRRRVSAFALTEVDAGSVRPTALYRDADRGRKTLYLNGEKLWCTNGTRAELFVVMARTPDKVVGGSFASRSPPSSNVYAGRGGGVSAALRLKAIGERRHPVQQREGSSREHLWQEGKV
jgi:hypothetical protein